jgi:hypothetical protein
VRARPRNASTAAPPVSPDDDRGALAAPREHVVHQPAEQLHRQVLEGQRRTVEQLEHEVARPVLPQWHHRRMAEAAVSLADHAGELMLGDVAADERADNFDGNFGVGPAGQACDGLRGKLRPIDRHEQAAVAREPGQRHVDKTELFCLAPGGNVLHFGFALRLEHPRVPARCRPARRY